MDCGMGGILARKMEIGKWKLVRRRARLKSGRGRKKQIPRYARDDKYFQFGQEVEGMK